MCTALVVREEYWDRQIEICAKLSGFELNHIQIEYVKAAIIDFAEYAGRCLRQLIDLLSKAFTQAVIIIRDSFSETLEAISDLWKSCEITPEDDFDMVCDKLENRMLYLNRKQCIRNEQYYKSQFKLAKINYNIMNHDRRC